MGWQDKIPWTIIRDEAGRVDIDPKLVAAIIAVESGGDPYSMRYEPNFRFRLMPYKFAKINGITEETENILQSSSFGLMQIMGTVCRELGFQKSLLMLVEPDLNIELGCKKLSQLFLKHQDTSDVIASYNAGSVRFEKDGSYKNQFYVNKVLQRMKELDEKK